jgi:hypothetical protein
MGRKSNVEKKRDLLLERLKNLKKNLSLNNLSIYQF